MSDVTTVSLDGLYRRQAEAQALRQPARRPLPQRPGVLASRRPGPGMDFAEVRPYQPGDDVRHIDWRVTARHRSPHTKVFHEEHERCWMILCDLRPSLYFASHGVYKSVLAAHLAALLCWSALAGGDRAGGVILQGRQWRAFRPSSRRAAVMPMLKALVEAHASLPQGVNATGTLDTGLQELRRLAPTGSRVFLISDFLDLGTDSHAYLHGVSAHRDVTALIPEDPLERTLPPPGRYHYRDELGPHSLDTRSPRLRAALEYSAEERRQRLTTQLRRAGINERWLDTGDDLGRRMAEWSLWRSHP